MIAWFLPFQVAHLLSLHASKWHAKALNGKKVYLITGNETTPNFAYISFMNDASLQLQLDA